MYALDSERRRDKRGNARNRDDDHGDDDGGGGGNASKCHSKKREFESSNVDSKTSNGSCKTPSFTSFINSSKGRQRVVRENEEPKKTEG